MIPVSYYLTLSAVLFVIGVLGVLLRRNALVMFMSLELMFNSANLLFVAFSAYHHVLDGQLFVFFVMTTAAAEVAVGLAIIVALFRKRGSVQVEDLNALKN